MTRTAVPTNSRCLAKPMWSGLGVNFQPSPEIEPRSSLGRHGDIGDVVENVRPLSSSPSSLR